MVERECACEKFERLEGAAMQIHLADFLERTDRNEATGATWYRCRRCDAQWLYKPADKRRKAALVRRAKQSNV